MQTHWSRVRETGKCLVGYYYLRDFTIPSSAACKKISFFFSEWCKVVTVDDEMEMRIIKTYTRKFACSFSAAFLLPVQNCWSRRKYSYYPFTSASFPKVDKRSMWASFVSSCFFSMVTGFHWITMRFTSNFKVFTVYASYTPPFFHEFLTCALCRKSKVRCVCIYDVDSYYAKYPSFSLFVHLISSCLWEET